MFGLLKQEKIHHEKPGMFTNINLLKIAGSFDKSERPEITHFIKITIP